jgi:hypothetical protein
LEALAAKAAAAASSSVAPQAAGASGDTGIPEKWRPGRPKGSGKKTASAAAAAPSSSRHRGRPPGSKNKKAPAVFRVAATPAGPRAAASPPLGPSRFFFYIALFCSIYRSRIRLQSISELGHLSIRRMRQALFASGGCDSAVDDAADEAADAQNLQSCPPDAIGSNSILRTRQVLILLSAPRRGLTNV